MCQEGRDTIRVWVLPKANYRSPHEKAGGGLALARLGEYIDSWVKSHNTTWDWLCKQAGIPGSVGTGIRQGATPRPETLRKLSETMRVPVRDLAAMAGYFTAEELAPPTIEIGDPDLEMFVRGHYWEKLSTDEKRCFKALIEAVMESARERTLA